VSHDASETKPVFVGESSTGQDSFELLLHDAAKLREPELTPVGLLRPGELVDGKYRVDELLAAGGMGAVYRATRTVSGKIVALKWLLPSVERSAARFVREARAAARIDHPNVVDVYDLGSHRGGHYLVMELLHGVSLGERLQAGPLAVHELGAIMVPLLRGVAAAHARGVIHRDLKPDNVFLCEGPDGEPREPKVLDFGIAKLRTSQLEQEHLTGSGSAIGTPAYMSPEQLADARGVDERTDIYAAGVIMFEALTGRLPFSGEHGAAARRPLCELPALRSLAPHVPEELERVVLRALAAQVEQRQPSVDVLIAELLPLFRGEHRRLATTSSRVVRFAIALCAALLLLGLVLAYAPSERRMASARTQASVLPPPSAVGVGWRENTLVTSVGPEAKREGCTPALVGDMGLLTSAACRLAAEAAAKSDAEPSANDKPRTRSEPRKHMSSAGSSREQVTPRAGRILLSDL
jgi:serine/threonine protein kinase